MRPLWVEAIAYFIAIAYLTDFLRHVFGHKR